MARVFLEKNIFHKVSTYMCKLKIREEGAPDKMGAYVLNS